MPQGPGTYGSKVGRPPKKKKKRKTASITKRKVTAVRKSTRRRYKA